MAPELAAFARFQAPEALFVMRMMCMFGMIFGWGIFLFVAISAVEYLQGRVFRKVLNNSTRNRTSNDNSTERNQSSREKEGELRWSHGQIVGTVVCIILADLSMAGLCFWISLIGGYLISYEILPAGQHWFWHLGRFTLRQHSQPSSVLRGLRCPRLAASTSLSCSPSPSRLSSYAAPSASPHLRDPAEPFNPRSNPAPT